VRATIGATPFQSLLTAFEDEEVDEVYIDVDIHTSEPVNPRKTKNLEFPGWQGIAVSLLS
jgi:hypothetical protein